MQPAHYNLKQRNKIERILNYYFFISVCLYFRAMIIALDNRTLQFVIPHFFPIRTSESSEKSGSSQVVRFEYNNIIIIMMK